MRKLAPLVLFSLLTLSSLGQIGIGTGTPSQSEIPVVSSIASHEVIRSGMTASSTNTHTVGLLSPYMQASRFLQQATLGPTEAEIVALAQSLDFEAWIDAQIPELQDPSLANSLNMLQLTEDVKTDLYSYYNAQVNPGDSCNGNPIPPIDAVGAPIRSFMTPLTWWELMESNPDLLRQKMTLALSEIFVISQRSDLQGYPGPILNYYDLLSEYGFGHFNDLLNRVTWSYAMGGYLSHYGNPKAGIIPGTSPDENYAREVMQLFSIGLLELNKDGSLKLDSIGNPIETYETEDVENLARVFTGMSTRGLDSICSQIEDNVFIRRNQATTVPYMAMYPCYHDDSTKTFLDFTIDPILDDTLEVVDAINYLSNHDNTAPFICTRLIQQFVSSNPSPSFVEDISEVFDNTNGHLGAVVKAILLHPQARNCGPSQLGTNRGKMRESLLRMYHFARAMNKGDSLNYFTDTENKLLVATDQAFSRSPTVFNFYSPFYVPNTEWETEGLVGPEFYLHNYRTSISFPDMLMQIIYHDTVALAASIPRQCAIPYETPIDWADWETYAAQPETLLNKLNMIFTRGQMTHHTSSVIRTAINDIKLTDYGPDYHLYRAKMGVMLTLFSPEYSILK